MYELSSYGKTIKGSVMVRGINYPNLANCTQKELELIYAGGKSSLVIKVDKKSKRSTSGEEK